MLHQRRIASRAVGLTVATVLAGAAGGCSGFSPPPGQTELSGTLRMFPPLQALTEPIHIQWDDPCGVAPVPSPRCSAN
jgi:hypothetical protein